MITKDLITKLVEEKLSETDCYLVDIHVGSGNQISIEIDNDNGVNVKDCIAVSRHVEGNLDREVEDFALQVSSPGVGQPLKIMRQYKKNVGRNVEVKTLEGIVIEGKLLSVDEEQLELEVKDKKNKKQTVKQNIPFENIKETKSVISFK